MTTGKATGRSQIAGAPSCAPDADGDHRDDMIRAGPRMLETAGESAHFAFLDVGLRGLGEGEKRGGERQRGEFLRVTGGGFHNIPFSRMTVRWIVQ